MGNPQPRARLFYLLPKIHKDPAKWSRPHVIPPGRPIVSDCDSETYHTAEYIDSFLNPLSCRHPSYIQDTYDFIQKVSGLHVPSNSFLFTLDIDSLYTNIDINEGIQTVKNIFSKFPNKTRPEKELLQLLDINLRRNDFQFDNKFYLQIKGTAMGKKFAPAYANIFMAEWETSALAGCEKKPLHYFRYLDDIWGVWHHTQEEFGEFLSALNRHNPSIKLKSTINSGSVDFLDTTTFKGEHFQATNNLDVKVFFKETDSHALLHKSSFHPRHIFKGLLKSQLLRFHRICTHRGDFLEATRTLFRALSTRGYSRSFRRQALREFLEKKPVHGSSVIPLVSTFSFPTTLLVKNIKNNFSKILGNHSTFLGCRIIAAYRKNKNLRDLLVKAKIRPVPTTVSRCRGEFYRHRRWIRSQVNGEVFKGETQGSPHTKNCVYLITCGVCGVQYVGETGNTLLLRFTQHRYNMLRGKETHTPLVSHFLGHGWLSLQATVIEHDPMWSTAQRIRAERRWILRLGTQVPGGLNLK